MSMRTAVGAVVAMSAAELVCPSAASAACDPSVALVISEFMAANDHALADENGDFSDWIEVYNPCLGSVDLSGWSLTDDPDDLTRWRFPALSLARGEALVVFASGKNRAVAGLPLHTNFKLDADGEFLALVEPDGTTIAQAFSPSYPPQVADVSYGFEQASSLLLERGSTASFHVPTADDATLGDDWAVPAFDDSSWPFGPTGLGFVGDTSTGLAVSVYKANVAVNDLATAEAILGDPAMQTSIHSETAPVINYLNTGSAAHYAGDRTFPGMTIGTDVNDFVVLATGHIIIPAAGAWTFGVNSDDGFSLELTREPFSFQSSYPGQRGASDTLSVFNITDPGLYRIRLVMYERQGGSELELFAAQGSFTSWSSTSFRLVGDTANGGLAVNDLVSEIGTDVGAEMRGVGTSLWSRLAFDVADPASLGVLTLRMKYEDGFVLFLNGQEVARRNAPEPAPWDAAALANRPIELAGDAERIDLTDAIGWLQPGGNLLAVHGLNDALAEPDFLLVPELEATGTRFDVSEPRFFTQPTPGRVNAAAGYPGVSEAPQFSHPSSTFTANFSLTLSALAPGALIRYTTDGTEPTETHGTDYTAPIPITNSTRVRARLFEPGLAPGPIVSRLYAKLDPSVTSFSSDLPIVVVHTFGSSIVEDWLTESLTSVIDTTLGRATITDLPDFVGPAGIRIRGTSSRGFPKKQYFLETWDDNHKDREVTFLDFPPESDFILYAPYSEKSLVQNVLAYGWYNATGRYAVRTRFCEMYLRTGTGPVTSSDYVGIYVVMEKIKQDPARLNIAELLPTDETPPAVTGGYIVKKDRLDPGDAGFLTSRGQRLAYVDPKEEEITAAQAAWLKDYVDAFETALYGPDFSDPGIGYAAYIDPDSFVDHHILVEMTKNIDGFRLSTYMFKDRIGRLQMGPVWDYNLSLGNANYLEGWLPEDWYNALLSDTDYPYYRRLFEDPEFQLRYADRWFALRRGPFATAKLLADFDGAIAQVQDAAPRNFQRWPIIGKSIWPNWFVGATWEEDVGWTRQWLIDRLAWIDGQFMAPPVYSHPGGAVPIGYNLEISAPEGTIYYTLDGTDPRLPGGELSSGALVYTEPIVLVSPTRVRARFLGAESWSPGNDATFEPYPVARVNEVLPLNVATISDEEGEFDPWIELFNPAGSLADLGGLFLTDDEEVADKWPIPAGSEPCGGERLLVWADGEPAEGPLHANFTLSPSGGTVYLYDGAGILIDSLTRPALAPNVSFGRHPDGGTSLQQFLHPTPATANQPNATPILVNEYNAVSPTKYLAGTASDTYWGRVLGNGGDWFELVIVEDHLDLRGWSVVVRDQAGLAGDTQQTLTFTESAALSDLRAGSILTISAELPSDVGYDPSAGDWWINLRSGPAGDGLYISALSFSVSNDNTQIRVRNRHGVVVFGPAGEGINPASGIGSDEVFKLEADPGPGITAGSPYNDGTSSTFGAPNLWSAGTVTQNFGALRGLAVRPCTVDGDCDDGNPCTDDACSGDRCEHAPNAAPCDDGNPCTEGDACAGRTCVGIVAGQCCAGSCGCSDADSCTLDACGPSGCSHAPDCSLSGTVFYYRDSSAVEPSSKGVAAVPIDTSADILEDAVTTTGGAYQGGNHFGDLRVETLSKFGTPRAADDNGAITSFDAALVARSAVSAIVLSPNQVLAGDVTGNGEVSSLDAARIAQYAAMLVDHFEVASAVGSDWRFLRCDTYASATNQTCSEPVYLHQPLTGPVSDDFYAILYGDVSGSWVPESGEGAGLVTSVERPGSSPEEQAAARSDRETAARLKGRAVARAVRQAADGPVRLALEAAGGFLAPGQRREVLLLVENAAGVEALDLELAFPRGRLRLVDVRPVGIGSGLALASHDLGGRLRLGLYGVEPLYGSGAIVALAFEALQPLAGLPPLRIEGRANEGRIELLPAELRIPERPDRRPVRPAITGTR